MNPVMASALLLALLAFQPTLIYGIRGTVTGHRHGGPGRDSAPLAELHLALDSGDLLVRAARAAAADHAAAPAAAAEGGSGHTPAASIVGIGGSSGGGKRARNNSNNNKKANRNAAAAATAAAGEGAPLSGGRKHHGQERKLAGAAAGTQQPHMHQALGNNNSNNNKGKQRQFLKSQQHQNHGKRSGSKSKAATTTAAAGAAEKPTDAHEKPKSTCRYAKSAWSECDASTNMRSRTLTLKKGESHCLPTRTMEKKCKKSCRYEKGSFSECTNGQMTRVDILKPSGNHAADSSCEPVRPFTKKCNPGGGAGKQQGGKANRERKNKDKASRRAPQQA